MQMPIAGHCFFMYRVCSWYLSFRVRLVCPTYASLQVLHVNEYTPLVSCGVRGGCGYGMWSNELHNCVVVFESNFNISVFEEIGDFSNMR